MSEQFEHYKPINPLPQEIQALPHGETVCKFCGVSYLIHNEIKRLENELEVTRKQLEGYKDMKMRFGELEESRRGMMEDNEKYQCQVLDLSGTVSELGEDLRRRGAELESASADNVRLNDDLKLCDHQMKQDSTRIANFEKHHNLYPSLLKQISILKETKTQNSSDLRNLQNYVGSQMKVLRAYTSVISNKSQSFQTQLTTMTTENTTLESRISSLQSEKRILHEQIKVFEQSSTTLNHTQDQNVQLSLLVAETQREVEILKCTVLESLEEITLLKRAAQSKSRENDELKARANSLTERYTKQIGDLNNKYVSSLEIQNLLKNKIKSHVHEFQGVIEEKQLNASKHSMLEQQNTDLSQKLSQLSCEIKSLIDKNRNSSEHHRLQLSELHVSYQQQLNDALTKTTTYKTELDKLESLRSKHEAELRDVMNQTAGKYEEQLRGVSQSNKEVHANLERQIEMLSTQYSHDLTSKERSIREIEKSFSLQLDNVKSDKKYLATNISQLNCQLSDYEKTIKRLREHECSPAAPQQDSAELTGLKSRNKELEGEVLMLQRIVQKECEERMELKTKLDGVKVQCSTPNPVQTAGNSSRSSDDRSSANILKGRPKRENTLNKGTRRGSHTNYRLRRI